jgi:hypothetical protein
MANFFLKVGRIIALFGCVASVLGVVMSASLIFSKPAKQSDNAPNIGFREDHDGQRHQPADSSAATPLAISLTWFLGSALAFCYWSAMVVVFTEVLRLREARERQQMRKELENAEVLRLPE